MMCRTQFNAEVLRKYCNDHPNMAGQKDTNCLQLRHESWTDFAIRHGHGTAQEYLHIFEYEKRLRDESHATQWIQIQAGDESEYFISFNSKNLSIDSTMCFSVEDEFEVLFVERPKKKPGETREPRDLRGWQATVIETDVSTIRAAISPSFAVL